MSNEPKVDLAGVDELVGRLRARTSWNEALLTNPPRPAPDRDCIDAADMIQSLAAQLADARAENARLTLTVRKLQGNQAALEAALKENPNAG